MSISDVNHVPKSLISAVNSKISKIILPTLQVECYEPNTNNVNYLLLDMIA